jgi:hypothetical protein
LADESHFDSSVVDLARRRRGESCNPIHGGCCDPLSRNIPQGELFACCCLEGNESNARASCMLNLLFLLRKKCDVFITRSKRKEITAAAAAKMNDEE